MEDKTIASLLAEMTAIEDKIQERRDELVCLALEVDVCPKCGVHPAVAKWVVSGQWEPPFKPGKGVSLLVEKLQCLCVCGHSWIKD